MRDATEDGGWVESAEGRRAPSPLTPASGCRQLSLRPALAEASALRNFSASAPSSASSASFGGRFGSARLHVAPDALTILIPERRS
jgi:hypothetical protein